MEHLPAPRGDSPGTWHHVINRGLARRPVFETEEDVRRLLALIARQVRAGRIEIHAYAILTTHFHALVRSRTGELSKVLMDVESRFVRWFNRRRGRDGPLFSTRFRSRVVDSHEYWFAAVRYIDRNPVEAGLANEACEYPYGSAWHYVRSRGPIWLSRDVIEARVVTWNRGAAFDAAAYQRTFSRRPSKSQTWMVERRIELGPTYAPTARGAFDPLAVAPPDVREELLERVRLADGTVLAAPSIDPSTLESVLARHAYADPHWTRRSQRGRTIDLWKVLRDGLLMSLCGLTRGEAAARGRRSMSAIQRCWQQHRELLQDDPIYLRRVAAAIDECVRAEFD